MAEAADRQERFPVLRGLHDREEISRRISSVVLAGRLPRHFWLAFLAAFLLVLVLLLEPIPVFAALLNPRT